MDKTQDFINKTSPEIAIISVGVNNSYKHPSEAVIKRLLEVCRPNGLYRTDKDGTIFIVNVEGENVVSKLKTKVNGGD
jgi:competence protein ComEC